MAASLTPFWETAGVACGRCGTPSLVRTGSSVVGGPCTSEAWSPWRCARCGGVAADDDVAAALAGLSRGGARIDG